MSLLLGLLAPLSPLGLLRPRAGWSDSPAPSLEAARVKLREGLAHPGTTPFAPVALLQLVLDLDARVSELECDGWGTSA